MTKVCVFMAVGTALIFLAITTRTTSLLPGSVSSSGGEYVRSFISRRKLKENNFNLSGRSRRWDQRGVNLEDYPLINPVPSSKAAIKTGPIEHGIPVMPYIPPKTPSRPKYGGVP